MKQTVKQTCSRAKDDEDPWLMIDALFLVDGLLVDGWLWLFFFFFFFFFAVAVDWCWYCVVLLLSWFIDPLLDGGKFVCCRWCCYYFCAFVWLNSVVLLCALPDALMPVFLFLLRFGMHDEDYEGWWMMVSFCLSWLMMTQWFLMDPNGALPGFVVRLRGGWWIGRKTQRGSQSRGRGGICILWYSHP